MSEPLSAVDSRDVLSTLRRLVSEGAADDVPAKVDARDKLILTPALRVVTPDPAPETPVAADWQPEAADLTSALQEDLVDAVEDSLPELSPQDEAVLREIIRDVIREELQGALGERITRNLRKLVRAEVARAHSMRDGS